MGNDPAAAETILVTRDGPLTWIVLNRPERLNALNSKMLDELDQALDYLSDDLSTRVIAIRGAGRAFSSGYDIERDESAIGDAVDAVEDHDRLARNVKRFLKIWDHPKPVIAAVHGYCLAGATQLCALCDITIVANDAVIGLPALPIGGGYITPLWVPLVGPKRAKQMSFVAGSRISGDTAASWGWANYAVPLPDLFEDVKQLAIQISKIPAPILRMKKLAINRVVEAAGFRAAALLGAETDALLHQSKAVEQIVELIKSNGLKEAISIFNRSDETASP